MNKELATLYDVESWHCCYIGYAIVEILKKEERIIFDEAAISESLEFSD